MRASANLPLDAVPTTSTSGIPERASEIIRRKMDVSSTTSTRVFISPGSQSTLVQNLARVQDRDDLAAGPADALKEARLFGWNVDRQRFSLPRLDLEHF